MSVNFKYSTRYSFSSRHDSDLVRDNDPGNALRVLDGINGIRDLGIIDIGLGGSEKGYPNVIFRVL